MAAEGEMEVEAGTEVDTKGEDKTPEMLVILPSSSKTSSSVTRTAELLMAAEGEIEVETGTEVETKGEDHSSLYLFEIETVAGQNH